MKLRAHDFEDDRYDRIMRKLKSRKYRRVMTRHHLTPRSRQGGNEEANLLRLYSDRHEIWHALFDNRTLEETIALLQRVSQMKRKTHKLLRIAAD